MTDPTHFSANSIDIYFQSKRAGVEADLPQKLIDFIAATQQTLDCAIYDFRHPKVLEAMAQLAQSGKQLRIAFDGGKQVATSTYADPKPSGSETAIDQAGLGQYAQAIHEGSYLMHNKFLVRDGRYVWTGSANFTVGGLELQDNNCVVLDSTQLASQYSTTFEDLISPNHDKSHKGKGKHDSANQPPFPVAVAAVNVGDTRITPYFSPTQGEEIEKIVMNALIGAQKVRVIAFLISDPGIMSALASYGANPNFDIKGVYDPQGMKDVTRNKKDTSAFWFLNDPRFVAAPTHAFNPKGEQDFMHNKTLIIDDNTVITGSYNFSENAESNDENILQIGSDAVALAYNTYFEKLFETYSQHHAATGGHSQTTEAANAAESSSTEQQVPSPSSQPATHKKATHASGTRTKKTTATKSTTTRKRVHQAKPKSGA